MRSYLDIILDEIENFHNYLNSYEIDIKKNRHLKLKEKVHFFIARLCLKTTEYFIVKVFNAK